MRLTSSGRRIAGSLFFLVFLGLWTSVLPSAYAADTSAPGAATASSKDIVLRGDAVCTSCHDEGDGPELLAIGKTKHGTKADQRTPTCISCHGESDKHVKNPGGAKKRLAPDVTFAARFNNKTSANEQTGACLTCHKADSKRSHWEGSIHQTRDVACSACHTVHAAKDKVLAKKTQFEVCFTCHKEQRAQFNRPSRHPILEGKVSCSDCHNAHGTVGPKLMKRDSVVETCFQCHMEKRGPFVRPHEPVTEDCGTCHSPHGTTVENMLKARPPFLCNECHSPHGAAMPQLTNQSAPPALFSGKTGVNYTQGRGCVNCHTEVHGSNNPTSRGPNPQFLLR